MGLIDDFVNRASREVTGARLDLTRDALGAIDSLARSVEARYRDRFQRSIRDSDTAVAGFGELAQRMVASAAARESKAVEASDVQRAVSQCGIVFVCAPPPPER